MNFLENMFGGKEKKIEVSRNGLIERKQSLEVNIKNIEAFGDGLPDVASRVKGMRKLIEKIDIEIGDNK